MSKLPEGWEEKKLIDLCSKPQYGWTSPATNEGTVKLLRTTDISNGKLNWKTVPYCLNEPKDIDKYKITKNDIFVSRAGSVGLSYLVKQIDEIAVFASYLIRFKPNQELSPDFLSYFLNSSKYWEQLTELSAGIAVQNVNATKLGNLNIPIPPKETQQKIVQKLDKLMPKIRECKERLEKIPEIIKRYKQAVLNAAVTGKLTADWRGENPLIQITIGDISDSIQIGPFGSQLHKSDYIQNGIPIINPMHFSNMEIIADKNFSIGKQKYNELQKYKLKTGDVLLARRGEMGRAAIVTKNENGYLCGTGSLFIRPQKKINSNFLFIILRSIQTSEFLEQNAAGTTMKNLNKRIVSMIPFCLPSLAEQEEIVKKVEELFKKADTIIERYKKSQSMVDKLDQSVLAKAFRGELVK
ncbi:MAG: restriction endonuclease subunit S [Deltaproteobacteria bacterium]|nr:restriction endonuclease subunit S [Deltaproteobacteria bacterium]